MMNPDGGRRNGQGGIGIEVKRLAEKQRDQEEQQSRVAELFDRLGGAGKIRIFRVLENGDEAYAGVLDVDENMGEELEERMASRVGGGQFLVIGTHKGKQVGRVRISLDERMFPAKLSDAEARRVAPPPEQQRGGGVGDIAALMMQQQQQAEATRTEMQKSNQAMMLAMMQIQENNAARLVEMTRALAGGRAEPSSASALSQVADMAKLLQGFGWGPAKEASGTSSDLSFGEQVLLGPLKAMAEKVGDRVGEAIVKQSQAQQAPAPALPSAAPQLPPPSQHAAAPGFMKKPAPGAEVRLPPGAKLISREELALRRAQHPGGPGPIAVPVPPSPPRPAPTVGEAVPSAVQK